MENFIKMQDKFIKNVNNAKMSNKLSHAFLIESSSNQNLDFAISYLLAAIFSEGDKPDSEYFSLMQRQTPDIIIYDLDEGKLSKEDALKIQERFNMKALEISNKQVYIIKNIDKATPIVLNSLLKFLEEPSDNIYAIFTTKNKEKVLETIISRTNVYTLKNNDIQTIRNILSESFNENDVYLISLISDDEILIQEYLNSQVLQDFKNNINSLILSIENDLFYLKVHELIDSYEKEELEIFLSLFYLVVSNKRSHELLGISKEVQQLLASINDYGKLLDAILTARIRLDSNANKGLILDAFSIEIERSLL